jgi:hypothetical protein
MLGADNDDGEYDKEEEYFSAILLGAYTLQLCRSLIYPG